MDSHQPSTTATKRLLMGDGSWLVMATIHPLLSIHGVPPTGVWVWETDHGGRGSSSWAYPWGHVRSYPDTPSYHCRVMISLGHLSTNASGQGIASFSQVHLVSLLARGDGMWCFHCFRISTTKQCPRPVGRTYPFNSPTMGGISIGMANHFQMAYLLVPASFSTTPRRGG